MGSDEKKNKRNQRNKKKINDGGAPENDESKMITDERFAAAQSDPRFMEPPKRRSKVEIDSRFNRMFTNKSFVSSKAPIDKRGKLKTDNNTKAGSSLGRYYRVEQPEKKDVDDKVESDSESESDKLNTISDNDDEEEEENEEEEEEEENEEEEGVMQSSGDDDDENEEEEEVMQSSDESSSTSTTDSDDESVDEEEDTFMQQEENVPEIDKETRRLAVVNLDWSHVRAADLYVLLSSFLPKGGQIMSAAVYPTDFGLQRMEEESVHGPVGLFDDEKEKEEDDDDDDEIDNKKLRAYELSRLRYYYAVVECDSVATADYLYKTCDGVEFERSANKLDLRFIPDSMDFKHKPRDIATEAPGNYEGLDFQTRALQHSNIQLMWDEDEPMRTKTLKSLQKSEQPGESELNEILAMDESETDEDEHADDMSTKKHKRKDMYRALIQSGGGSDESGEEDDNQDMEVTFNSGLEDISKRIMEKKDKKSETVWEANLRKRKEKKKAMKNRSKYSSDDDNSDGTDKELGEQPDDFFEEENSGKVGTREVEASTAELELLLADDMGTDNNIKGFNLKPKKSKKGKKDKETPDEGKILSNDIDDPRFSAYLTDSRFKLDPTDPQFKWSAAYARQTAQQKKGDDKLVVQVDSSVISEMKGSETAVKSVEPQTKDKHEISATIRSVKMKTKQLTLPSQVKKVNWKNQHLRPKAKIQK